jgi:hypothetical protein
MHTRPVCPDTSTLEEGIAAAYDWCMNSQTLTLSRRFLKRVLKAILPRLVHLRLIAWRAGTPWIRSFAHSNLGGLRRLTPVSGNHGWERGTPIDRYYIDEFLRMRAADVRGRVLEIGDDRYTRAFGAERVVKSDVLHYVEGNEQATLVGDLTQPNGLPSETFDCIICTQTLQMIYEVKRAISTLHMMLKPGGALLVTNHGTSKICRLLGVDEWGEYWRLTAQSARLLFEEHFPAANVEVATYGNVLAAIASLHGLAAEELTRKELEYHDARFEVIVAVRAIRP